MNSVRRRLIARLGRFLETVGARLFRADDRTAVEHGWQITASRGGLSRLYRDPRFDTIRACPKCSGDGVTDSEPCVPCDGTGRVIRVALCRQGELP
jgi:hypothetical protein